MTVMAGETTAASATLLAGIVGSTAYGLNGPASDVDRLAFFAEPSLNLLGLNRPAETEVTTRPDRTRHEAAKAVRLLLSANPTVTELLWLPEDLYEERSDLGERLLMLRGAFPTAPRVRDAYLGYATQQLRKLVNHGDCGVERRPAKLAKHARHLMRLVEQGLELYTTGRLTVRLPDPERYLAFGEQVAADPRDAEPYLEAARRRFDAARTALSDQPDEDAVEAWLLDVRRAHWPCAA